MPIDNAGLVACLLDLQGDFLGLSHVRMQIQTKKTQKFRISKFVLIFSRQKIVDQKTREMKKSWKMAAKFVDF